MTEWDILNNLIIGFPPFATIFFLAASIAAAIIFIVGFSRNGIDFIKHGFKQQNLTAILDKLATKEDIVCLKEDIESLRKETKDDIASLRSDFTGLRSDFTKMENELATIKVNHFGHLKNFLTELTGILVDKNIFTNENKARLDNHLSGM